MMDNTHNYRAYAGIGSRETPSEILQIMRDIGKKLYEFGWTLRSGGARGADMAFEDGIHEALYSTRTQLPEWAKEIYLPWPKYNGHGSSLHPRRYPFEPNEITVASQLHPAWDRLTDSARNLHTRNVRQIIGCRQLLGEYRKSKFVVCWTHRGLLKGGTAQALRLAQELNIPIFNLGTARSDSDLKAILRELVEYQGEVHTDEDLCCN